MSRPPYSMQRVVRMFIAPPYDWATNPKKTELAHVRWSFVELACGHVKRDPWEIYSNETAVRVRAGLHLAFTPDGERKCRCYKCTRPHP